MCVCLILHKKLKFEMSDSCLIISRGLEAIIASRLSNAILFCIPSIFHTFASPYSIYYFILFIIYHNNDYYYFYYYYFYFYLFIYFFFCSFNYLIIIQYFNIPS